jgi:ribA/ribD-fused uncharacterized protein
MEKIPYKDLAKHLETTIDDVLMEVNVTDKYVAFWGSVFSNFYPCEIHVTNDWWDKPVDLHFTSSEQYFMWLKATYFDDYETADKILEAKTPKEAKALGRKVKGFDEKEWADAREYAMWNAVLLKFRQNPDIKELLLDPDFADKGFVEGSPVDSIWGVGIDWRDPRIADEENWIGLNLLGKTLDRVRHTLKIE